MRAKPSILQINNNDYIAYHQFKGDSKKPGIIFLGGFMSDMEGTKATFLEDYCKENNISFIRFDYFGHGQSSQKFTDGTITSWTQNAVDILDKLTDGPQILIGSSMGGWVMLLTALKRKEKIAAIIGIASAPDFTEDLIWQELDDNAKKEINENGEHLLQSEYGDDPYPITKKLIEDGRNNLLLQNEIDLTCPIRLLHGMKDDDVPFELSIRLSHKLKTNDVKITLLKKSDHRMSEPHDLAILQACIEELISLHN